MSTPVQGEAKGLGLEGFLVSAADVKAKESGAKVAPLTRPIEVINKDGIETHKNADPADDSFCCFSYLCCIPLAILSAITSLWRFVFGSGSDKVEPKPGDTSTKDARLVVANTVTLADGVTKKEVTTLSDATLREALKTKNRELLFKCSTLSTSKDVFPLHELFNAKEYDLIVELIMKGKCSVNQTDKEGNTLLQLLVNMGDVCLDINAGPEGKKKELLAWLLLQGADADINDIHGRNSLQIACVKRAFACAAILAGHTTYPNQKDKYGDTAAHMIAAAGDSAAFDALVANPKRKPSFNLFNNDKQSLFHVICRNAPLTKGHIQILKLICADKSLTVVDARDNEGNTALAYACRFGHVEAVKALLEAGAYTEGEDIQDKDGNTPLLLVAKDQMKLDTQVKVEITRLLLSNERTNLLAKDKKGFAVVHHLAISGQSEVLGTIVEAKPEADLGVNAPAGELGRTPLHLAVLSKQLTMASGLIRFLNADKTATDKEGNTAQQLAGSLHVKPEFRKSMVEMLDAEQYTPPQASVEEAVEDRKEEAVTAPVETTTVATDLNLHGVTADLKLDA